MKLSLISYTEFYSVHMHLVNYSRELDYVGAVDTYVPNLGMSLYVIKAAIDRISPAVQVSASPALMHCIQLCK